MTDSSQPNKLQPVLSTWGRFTTLYLKVLRFLVRRVFALLFMVTGFIGTVMGAIWVLMGNPIVVNNVPTTSITARLLYVAAPLIPIFFGWLLWRMKPFDPNDNWMKRLFGYEIR